MAHVSVRAEAQLVKHNKEKRQQERRLDKATLCMRHHMSGHVMLRASTQVTGNESGSEMPECSVLC